LPRPADERAFGFRTNQLVRILTAADIEQVHAALVQLGFEIPPDPQDGGAFEFITAAISLFLPPIIDEFLFGDTMPDNLSIIQDGSNDFAKILLKADIRGSKRGIPYVEFFNETLAVQQSQRKGIGNFARAFKQARSDGRAANEEFEIKLSEAEIRRKQALESDL